jgi:hypothetical protein
MDKTRFSEARNSEAKVCCRIQLKYTWMHPCIYQSKNKQSERDSPKDHDVYWEEPEHCKGKR